MFRRMLTQLSLLILMTLITLLLAACAPVSTPAAEPTDAETEEPEAEATEEAAPTESEAEDEATEAAEPTEAAFDWRMLEGEEIRIAMVSQPWTEFLTPYISEFEELTGITTTYEILPEDQFRQKTTVEFAAGTSDVDVFLSMLPQEGIKYDSAGWYADLGAMAENAAITNPDFDLADFNETAQNIGRLESGKLVGIPVYLETGVLFYNTALLEQAGIANPPATLEEVEDAASAIHDPDNGIYGICLRGKGAAATSQFASFLHTYGSDWVDSDGNANVLDPTFLEAINWYGSILLNYGPPGATSYHWPQCQDLFIQGKVGLWFDASVFYANLVNAETSTVVDQVAVAPAPVGPAGADPTVTGWVLSIYEGSEHKDAAWLFVQWALSKEMVLEAQLNNIATARTSAWESTQYKEQNAHPEVDEVLLTQFANGNPNWNPPVLNVGEARDSIGTLIITAIEGGDVAGIAEDVNTKLQQLLDETP